MGTLQENIRGYEHHIQMTLHFISDIINEMRLSLKGATECKYVASVLNKFQLYPAQPKFFIVSKERMRNVMINHIGAVATKSISKNKMLDDVSPEQDT